MGGRLIAVMAGCAAFAVAPSGALAQGGFPDYRQAAADQYPTQPPPADNGSGSNAGGGGAGAPQTGGSSGNPRPAHHHSAHRGGTVKHANANGAAPTGGRGATAPVAVPTKPVPAAKGSLPFTGSDLSGLVVLALILIAAGFLAGAASRATRRRRRRAPA